MAVVRNMGYPNQLRRVVVSTVVVSTMADAGRIVR
jgi:hypothetical protein